MAFAKRTPPTIKASVHFVKTAVGDRKYPVLMLDAEFNGRKSYLKVTRMFAKALLDHSNDLRLFVDACATNDWSLIGLPVIDENKKDVLAGIYGGPTTYSNEDAVGPDVKKSTALPVENLQPDVTEDKITFK